MGMRDLLPWRFRLSEDETNILWESATFIFDTNFLLDLYRVSRSTAESFLNVLDKIHNRVWIPYQVVDEFTLKKDDTRHQESESFDKALNELNKWEVDQSEFKELRNCLKKAGRLVSSELEYLFDEQDQYLSSISEVSKKIRETIKNISEEHSYSHYEEDGISNRILALFNSSKVGRPFGKDVLEELYKEADLRYEKSQPPGFEDSKKEGNRKYGDFIIWKEILEFAKSSSSPIIFVTGDKKEDWWTKKNGKILAPHVELRREFHECTNQLFWMYTPTLFLKFASDKLMVDVNKKSLQESHEIAEIELDENEISTSTNSHADTGKISSNQFHRSSNPNNRYSFQERQVRLSRSSALGLNPFELPAQVTGLSELKRLHGINSSMAANVGPFSKYLQFHPILESLDMARHPQSIYGQILQSSIIRPISDLDNISKSVNRYMWKL